MGSKCRWTDNGVRNDIEQMSDEPPRCTEFKANGNSLPHKSQNITLEIKHFTLDIDIGQDVLCTIALAVISTFYLLFPISVQWWHCLQKPKRTAQTG